MSIGLHHPFHLHGHHFYVLEEGVLSTPIANLSKEEINKWMNREWKLHDKLPVKDTVSVPSGGYAIIRFYTDNPGRIRNTSVNK